MVVVACSDTESLSMSVVFKKGFAALRYLNVGKLIRPEETIAIPAIMVPPKSARPLRNWALLINFLIILNATRNTVHPTRKTLLDLKYTQHQFSQMIQLPKGMQIEK